MDNSHTPLKNALLAIRELRAKVERLERAQHEPIAVVGLSCRFPGADDAAAFWELLAQGHEAISDVPPWRWDVDAFYNPDPDAPGTMYSKRGGFLSDIDQFDAGFFGITPREASRLDPQQRLLMEQAWYAFENAAQPADLLRGQKVGVFVGAMNHDYHQLQLQQTADLDAYTGTGNGASFLAGRLSYFFGLNGPSLVLDTACSSALVATHLACRALRNGEADVALAGGVNLILAPESSVTLSRFKAISPSGHCRAFDAGADGYVRGEGCGLVVLKRLSDALASNDTIRAVIRGSAVNHSGPSAGLTVPNGPAQELVIRAALRDANVTAADISYVEAHGTGTPLGDPIEFGALAEVFAGTRNGDKPLLFGSVKTNFGHLEAAAGAAGLVKVVLSLENEQIPPHLNFQSSNPQINLMDIPARVPTQLTPWAGDTRLAGVSSFGMNGTNAHLIVAAAPSPEPIAAPERPRHVLALSAKTPSALATLVERYTAHLQYESVSFADVAFTSTTGRAHLEYRLAVDAASAGEAVKALGKKALPETRTAAPRIAFLYTGQGSLYAGAGRHLFETQPVFRQALEHCDALLPQVSLINALYTDTDLLTQASYIQPVMFALSYALTEVWRSWGVKPAVVLGHSLGEFAAAHTAGIFDLEAGLSLVHQRGQLMQDLPDHGVMLSVSADAQTVQAEIAPYADRVSMGVLNGPTTTVVSGNAGAIDALAQRFQAQGIKTKRLDTSHAFHSPLMDSITGAFEQTAAQLTFRAPTIPLISNVTGQRLTAAPDAGYWRRHIREAVRFHAGITALAQEGITHFVEIGPQPALTVLGQRNLPDYEAVWLPSLRKNKDDWRVLLGSLSTLYEAGVSIDWRGFERDFPRRRVALPHYPFERRRYWLKTTPQAPKSPQPQSNHVYTVGWQSADLTARPPTSEQGSWLICTDESGVGDALASRLEACVLVRYGEAFQQDGTGYTVNPLAQADFKRLFDSVGPIRGLINLWSLDPAETPLAAQERICGAGLNLVQTLPTATPTYWVSRGAFAESPQQATLWGLGRVIRAEHPAFEPHLLDVGDSSPAEAAERIRAALGQSDPEVIWRQGRALVPDIAPITLTHQPWQPRRDRAWLITGGLGGLGLRVARWLVKQGVTHLIVMSRRANSEEAQATAATLAAEGVTIHRIAGDVSHAADVEAVIAEYGPLAGIFHCAGVLDDGILIKQTWDRFQKVLAAKVAGAWNLHLATRAMDLQAFVLFSSVSALVGPPGQGNYAAGNAFLDGLAAHRRAAGLPALSINWGPWGEVGMAANTSHAPHDLIPPETALATLGTLLAAHTTKSQYMVLPIEWEHYQISRPTSEQPASFVDQLAQTSPAERRDVLTAEVLRRIAAVLEMDSADSLDLDMPLQEMGVDSVLALELSVTLSELAGRAFGATLVFEHPTVRDLLAYLADVLLPEDEATPDASPSGADADLRQRIEQMSDDEIEQELARKLAALQDL